MESEVGQGYVPRIAKPLPQPYFRRSQPQNLKQMDQKKNKGGRPRKTTDKKSKAITSRYTKAEYARVAARKKKANFTSLSEFVAHSALHNPIQQHFLKSEVEFIRTLSGMAGNINQIAHQANIVGVKPVEDAAMEAINEIKNFVQMISRRI